MTISNWPGALRFLLHPIIRITSFIRGECAADHPDFYGIVCGLVPWHDRCKHTHFVDDKKRVVIMWGDGWEPEIVKEKT